MAAPATPTTSRFQKPILFNVLQGNVTEGQFAMETQCIEFPGNYCI